MVNYWMGEWDLQGFALSPNADKKYAAILKDRLSDRKVEVAFGRPGFWHYKDATGLGAFSHLDHKDANRRKRFHDRFAHFVVMDMYSPAYFSLNYLW
jgi:hypothetical protein